VLESKPQQVKRFKGSKFKGAIVIDPCLKVSHNKGSRFKVQSSKVQL
jgi:hypothetical protein